MSHPSLLEVVQQLKDNKPFAGLHISNNSILNDLEGRHPCPTCGKSRKFFCYSCYVPIVQLEGKLPKLNVSSLCYNFQLLFNDIVFSYQ